MNRNYAQALAQALIASMDLPVDQRQSYQRWALMNNIPQSDDYDMTGFYTAMMSGDPAAASGVSLNDQRMHFPDQWKRPSHPTFSTESMYAKASGLPSVPSWHGGDLPGGGDSWTLRLPDGTPIAHDSPWFKSGVKSK